MSSNAATNGEIYHRGRTYAEHCAWLASLDDDERRIVYMPRGHLFNLAEISVLKRCLLTSKMTAGQRLQILDCIARCIFGPVTQEAIAAIEPCCDDGAEIIREINSLPIERRSTAFNDGDIFRLLAKLNPSLLRALELCEQHP
jgi:hypothetical protein